MAKISSPWVGQASGKLGEGVYYTSDGKTLARAKAAKVHNPQSNSQMVTRIALATASRAYSALQPLADHSFQNYAYGAKNQQRFVSLAAKMLRAKYWDASPVSRLSLANYNQKDLFEAVINDYTISEGNLPVVPVVLDPQVYPTITVTGFTSYQDVCDALGLPAGSQLTFVVLESDKSEADGGVVRALHYARVILEPNDGDMTSAFISGTAINKPNAKNEGSITFPESADGIAFKLDNLEVNECGAATVIASAWENNKWRRSTQKFVVRANVTTTGSETYYDTETFGEALDSYLPAAASGESDRYLNEGEE